MIFDELHRVILERKKSPPPDSYVASLFAKGRDRILKKIGEEAVEVIIASMSGNKEQIVSEMADLWFHCMVLMAEEGLSHEDVMKELQERFQRRRR
jgi:phosphoribosyl-ATP pyrophosphohydrolase